MVETSRNGRRLRCPHHQNVDAGRDLAAARVPWRRRRAGAGTLLFLAHVDHRLRGTPAIPLSAGSMPERDFQQLQRAFARRTAAGWVVGDVGRRQLIAGKNFFSKLRVKSDAAAKSAPPGFPGDVLFAAVEMFSGISTSSP